MLDRFNTRCSLVEDALFTLFFNSENFGVLGSEVTICISLVLWGFALLSAFRTQIQTAALNA